MDNAKQKQRIEMISDSTRTVQLQPVIDFLKAQGNQPAYRDEFDFDRDGHGTYFFTDPLDLDALRANFDFPPTIMLGNNALSDTRNFVSIVQRVGW